MIPVLNKIYSPFTNLRLNLLCTLSVLTVFFLTSNASAQGVDSLENSPRTPADSDSSKQGHSVRKATLLSAVLPGAGQVYNRKVWKVPVLYAGFAGLGYLIYFNQKKYTEFEDALLIRYDGNPDTEDAYADVYTDDNLRTLSDFYRRNRDLSVMGLTLLYVLNIIDAHVDAHLFNFNMDDDLSLHWQPELPINPRNGTLTPGVQLTLRF